MRPALLAQALCFTLAAAVVASLPTPAIARLRAAGLGWFLGAPVACALLLLLRPRALALHALLTAALAVLAARAAAQLVCVPLVRAVWYRAPHHALGLPPPSLFIPDEACPEAGVAAGRAVVASAAAVWLLAVGAGAGHRFAGLGASAALSAWALAVLNAYAWDWRPVLALLGVVGLSAYVTLADHDAPPQAEVADALAALWLPLPRALTELAAWLLQTEDSDDDDEA